MLTLKPTPMSNTDAVVDIHDVYGDVYVVDKGDDGDDVDDRDDKGEVQDDVDGDYHYDEHRHRQPLLKCDADCGYLCFMYQGCWRC